MMLPVYASAVAKKLKRQVRVGHIERRFQHGEGRCRRYRQPAPTPSCSRTCTTTENSGLRANDRVGR